jgi:hypothetical protein
LEAEEREEEEHLKRLLFRGFGGNRRLTAKEKGMSKSQAKENLAISATMRLAPRAVARLVPRSPRVYQENTTP